jgi:hypothetical protein
MQAGNPSMKELWIGVVEVLTEPNPKTGNTLAFTHAVTWAEVASDYAESVHAVFSGYGWTVLSLENVRPIGANGEISNETAEMIERAKSNPDACIFGTFHYYPSRPA